MLYPLIVFHHPRRNHYAPMGSADGGVFILYHLTIVRTLSSGLRDFSGVCGSVSYPIARSATGIWFSLTENARRQASSLNDPIKQPDIPISAARRRIIVAAAAVSWSIKRSRALSPKRAHSSPSSAHTRIAAPAVFIHSLHTNPDAVSRPHRRQRRKNAMTAYCRRWVQEFRRGQARGPHPRSDACPKSLVSNGEHS